MTVFQKYGASLLVLVITLVTALSQITDFGNKVTDLQLAAVAVQAAVVFGVGLAAGRWAGLFKTGGAVVLAAITAAIPLVLQGGAIGGHQIVVIVLAALNVLAAEIGVQIRTDPDLVVGETAVV